MRVKVREFETGKILFDGEVGLVHLHNDCSRYLTEDEGVPCVVVARGFEVRQAYKDSKDITIVRR